MLRRHAPVLGLALLLVALALPAFAQPAFSPRQLAILDSVMRPRGYVDQALHDEFWNAMSAGTRTVLTTGLDSSIRRTVETGLDFEREAWLSARQSLARGEPAYTTPYLITLKRLSRPGPGRRAFSAAIDWSKAIIAAAAEGKPAPDGRPITDELIDNSLLAVEAARLRVEALLSPIFRPPMHKWRLAHAGAEVSWPFPLIMTRETATVAGRKDEVEGFVYAVPINATDFIALESLAVGVPAGPEMLEAHAEAALGRLKAAPPQGPTERADFRGHASVVLTSRDSSDEGVGYVSVRAVQARDDNRLIAFIGRSMQSPQTATLLREQLENAVTLDDGF